MLAPATTVFACPLPEQGGERTGSECSDKHTAETLRGDLIRPGALLVRGDAATVRKKDWLGESSTPDRDRVLLREAGPDSFPN